jgi:hypothetical protein
MPAWIVALVLAIGVTAWVYNMLAKTNGNASPQSNMAVAGVAGFIIFLVMLSLMKMVLNF